MIDRIGDRINVATLVQVVSVTNTPGQVAPVGQVNVQLLVNQLDGYGNSTPQGTVYNVPYFRFAGGSNAILCDPQVNDCGLLVCADRDLSNVKKTKSQGNPGSRRRFNWGDGVYIGLFLGDAPDQYLAFKPTGITLSDKNGNVITMGADGIAVTAPNGMTINGARITPDGDVITKAGHDLDAHLHSGVQPGGGDTGPPV
jgi:hypothetical protein